MSIGTPHNKSSGLVRGVPVVPANHSIFLRVIRNHAFFLRSLGNYSFLGNFKEILGSLLKFRSHLIQIPIEATEEVCGMFNWKSRAETTVRSQSKGMQSMKVKVLTHAQYPCVHTIHAYLLKT